MFWKERETKEHFLQVGDSAWEGCQRGADTVLGLIESRIGRERTPQDDSNKLEDVWVVGEPFLGDCQVAFDVWSKLGGLGEVLISCSGRRSGSVYRDYEWDTPSFNHIVICWGYSQSWMYRIKKSRTLIPIYRDFRYSQIRSHVVLLLGSTFICVLYVNYCS
jgi:hypothetical protein